MAIDARGIRYVYSELQEITACHEDALCPSVGHPVIAFRIEFDEQKPSTVMALSLRDAVKLYADLDRIFAEYTELTGNPVPSFEELEEEERGIDG